jgi:ATP-binding cassette subfamily B protein RaxB
MDVRAGVQPARTLVMSTAFLRPMWRRVVPDIRQAEAAECGLACLAAIAAYHGQHSDLASLRRRHTVSMKGTTLGGLMAIAERMGLSARPLRLEPVSLPRLSLPAVLHWDMSHFVVLKHVKRNGNIVVQDPARGERQFTPAEVSSHFTGVALEVSPAANFEPAERIQPPKLLDLLGSPRGLLSPLVQTLVLSLILQAYVLAGPFYMQLVVDEAVAKDDRSLLGILACAFGVAMLFNAGAGVLRARILVYLQSKLSFDIGTGLFHHLLRLPLAYFERRHVGDLVSRFGSIEPIRNLLAEGLISALVDGAMAVLTCGMIFLYSPRLGTVVLCALAVYTLLRIAFYRMFRTRSLDLVHARARENSVFIETARAIQSIKIFNRESGRKALWSGRYADATAANARVEWLKATFRAINETIFGIENVVVIYLGALQVLNNQLTIGMLFAFVAYKQQFIDKAVRLVEKGIEFRMLDLHLERLADIVQAKPEHDAPIRRPPPAGRIEARNLSFRYGASEPFIFERVSFVIEPGDYVAVTGPSGGGKTTLLKVMLGLLEPTEGEVLIDGIPLATYGARAFRDHAGVVMQDDQLLSGSIADNICFFDQSFDHNFMLHCARLAGVYDEIVRMPMAFDTLVGDMGSTLSGGQRQRILLARALYRRPQILCMDEGTSHLDTEIEAKVNLAITRLGLTRIIIAHRPETIASAQRCLVMVGGAVRELSRYAASATQKEVADVSHVTEAEMLSS